MMKRYLQLLFIIGGLLACLTLAVPMTAQETVYYPTTEWRTSTPEEQGIDSAKLLDALNFAESNNIPLTSLTVIRHGYVVLDAYVHPYSAETRREILSATKGVVGILVGIAIDRGYFGGLDQRIVDLLPNRQMRNLDANKQAMTIRDLLNMSAGWTCTDATTYEMFGAPNWLSFILDLPMASEPGVEFNYCNMEPQLLVEALYEKNGKTPLDFAQEALFTPLGITDIAWPYSDAQGVQTGFFGLQLRPHDAAKIGYLMLHEGQWEGEQIVPSAWVDTVGCANSADCPFYRLLDKTYGYGYLWWQHAEGAYSASGVGNRIIVVPSKDMVIVTMTSGPASDDLLDTFFSQYLLPVAVSDAALPEDSEALASLQAHVQSRFTPPPKPVPDMPAITSTVNGQTYDIQMNNGPFGASSFSITFADAEAMLNLGFSNGSHAELLVGLDGVYRIEETPMGVMASRGEWLDSQVFQTVADAVGSGFIYRFKFDFSAVPIQVSVLEMTFGPEAITEAVPHIGN